MKNKYLIGAAIILLTVLTVQYLFLRKDLIIGDPAPDFTYENRQGQQRALSDFSGKYVILSFWGSWCAPCRVSNKKLLKFYKEVQSQNIEVISVGIEQRTKDWEQAMQEDSLFWDEQFSTLDMFQSGVAQIYGIEQTPAYFLLSPDQLILSKAETIDQIIQKYQQQKSG